MPALLGPFVGLFLGILFAWAGREELSRAQGASWLASRAAVASALLSLIVYAPICVYFLAFETDWSYAYFVDTRRIPSAFQLALALADAASIPIGMAVAVPRVRTRRIGPVLWLGLPCLSVVVIAVLVAGHRLSIQATYAQFHGDFGTRPVAGGPLGYALLWMDSLLAFGVVWTAQQIPKVRPKGA